MTSFNHKSLILVSGITECIRKYLTFEFVDGLVHVTSKLIQSSFGIGFQADFFGLVETLGQQIWRGNLFSQQPSILFGMVPQSHALSGYVMPIFMQQGRGYFAGFTLAILSVHHNGVVFVTAIDFGFTLGVLTNSDPDPTGSYPGQNFCEFFWFSQSHHLTWQPMAFRSAMNALRMLGSFILIWPFPL